MSDSKKKDSENLVGSEDPAVTIPDSETPGANPHAANEDMGQAQVQKRFDELEEVGYLGVEVDPTPDENYTLQTPPDAPTPETDPEMAAKARDAALGNRLTAVEQSSAQQAAKS